MQTSLGEVVGHEARGIGGPHSCSGIWRGSGKKKGTRSEGTPEGEDQGGVVGS